jgi:acetolactate synthase I/III small subunit
MSDVMAEQQPDLSSLTGSPGQKRKRDDGSPSSQRSKRPAPQAAMAPGDTTSFIENAIQAAESHGANGGMDVADFNALQQATQEGNEVSDPASATSTAQAALGMTAVTGIAGMFARRGYNIHSLAVGPTDDERISRLTVVVGAEAVQLEQIIKQLNKLVHVLKIVELEEGDAVERELQLVKVACDAATRSQIIELADVFRAKIVDVDPDSLTIEAAGSPDKLEAMVALLEPYGIREMVRSGTIALARGTRSITDGSKLRMQRVV